MIRFTKQLMIVLALAAVLPASARASFGADGRRPPKPPPQAYEACSGKSAGAEVTLTTPSGEKIQAVCRQMDDELFAVPVGPPPGMGKPPKECTCTDKSDQTSN